LGFQTGPGGGGGGGGVVVPEVLPLFLLHANSVMLNSSPAAIKAYNDRLFFLFIGTILFGHYNHQILACHFLTMAIL
jgi:hypothetical protein